MNGVSTLLTNKCFLFYIWSWKIFELYKSDKGVPDSWYYQLLTFMFKSVYYSFKNMSVYITFDFSHGQSWLCNHSYL